VPQQSKTSVAAILSLVSGLVFCIPGLSLLAIVLGIFGFVNSGKPGVSGRPLAIIGIILGIVVSIGWVGVGVFGYKFGSDLVAQVSAVGEAVPAMINNDPAKLKEFVADSITPQDITDFQQTVQGFGKFESINPGQFNANMIVPGHWSIRVTAKFEKDPSVPMYFEVKKNAQGKWQVSKLGTSSLR